MASFAGGSPTSSSASASSGRLYSQVGSDTDIGGGRENQDDYFAWKSPDGTVLVLCVLDGHGREVGKIAANSAQLKLREYFEANHQMLRINPYDCLVEAHEMAHRRIKTGFRDELEKDGYEVEEAPEGYLLKRMPPSQFWGCVHGGSSCSIVAIVDHMVYIANVGDSSGILSSTVPVLSSALLQHLGDAASIPESSAMISLAGGGDSQPSEAAAAAKVLGGKHASSESSGDNSASEDMVAEAEGSVSPYQDNLVITAEHSPESPSEFCRLRAFRAKPGDPRQPALAVVYDSPSADKTKCSPVFSLDDAGVPTVINKGKYYKNVRKEWASLVSTPSSARFQVNLNLNLNLNPNLNPNPNPNRNPNPNPNLGPLPGCPGVHEIAWRPASAHVR